MATQPPHVMRGLDPQQAFELVANAYIAAAVRTVNTPAARERFTEQAEHWLAAMNGLLEPDWWPMWPEAHQDEFRNDMERVRAVYATASLSNPLRDGMVGTRMLSTELKHMRNTFNRIDYIVTKISRTPPSHADPEQWRLATRTWFRDGVARHLTAREFDTQGYSLRMDVVDEFDTVRRQLAGTSPDGKMLDLLPDIHDPTHFCAFALLVINVRRRRAAQGRQRASRTERERDTVNSALDHLHEDEPDADRRREEAEIVKAYAQSRGIPLATLMPHGPGDGVEAAHSLARRFSRHTLLTSRQEVVYGRARATF